MKKQKLETDTNFTQLANGLDFYGIQIYVR